MDVYVVLMVTAITIYLLIVQSAVLRINPSTDALIILQRENSITPEYL